MAQTTWGQPPPVRLWTVVAVAIAAISCASIFIRLAEAPAPAIAAYRVGLAALVLVPWVLPRRREPTVAPWPRGQIGLIFLAGVFLAGHFLFWIRSLQYTSVASSVALVSLTPLFAGWLSGVLLKERPSRQLWLGLGIAIGGSAVVAGLDFQVSLDHLLGDALALAGALMAAGYFLCGRRLRQVLGIARYACAVYGSAAAFLVAICLATGIPLSGYNARTWACLVALALVPQLIGHTAFNWALRFLPATMVAVLTLGEPLGATMLAYLLLAEGLTAAKAAGLGLLFAGIWVSARAGTTG